MCYSRMSFIASPSPLQKCQAKPQHSMPLGGQTQFAHCAGSLHIRPNKAGACFKELRGFSELCWGSSPRKGGNAVWSKLWNHALDTLVTKAALAPTLSRTATSLSHEIWDKT